MAFKSWNSSEVACQLKVLGFGKYAESFQSNEITGVHLPLLTEDHLKEMGITSVGHRILLLRRFSDLAQGRPLASLCATRSSIPAGPVRPASTVDDTTASPQIAPDFSEPQRFGASQIRKSDARDDRSDSSSESDFGGRRAVNRNASPKRIPPSKSSQIPAAQSPRYSGVPRFAPQMRNRGMKDDRSDSSSESNADLGARRTGNRIPPIKEKRPREEWSDSSSVASGSEFGARRSGKSDDRQIMPSKRGEKAVKKDAKYDSLVTCQYCGGKFQPEAARRHIAVCGRMSRK